MLKRLFFFALMLIPSLACAANLPLLSQPIDPGNQLANLNALVQSINNGVEGTRAVLTTAVTTSGTTANTLMSYTAPGGLLAPGQSLRIRAWGTNSADANVKTLTFNFGATTAALVVTGSGNNWVGDFIVTATGTATQSVLATGQTGTSMLAPLEPASTVTLSAPVTVSIQGTAATSGTMTLNGAIIEEVQ